MREGGDVCGGGGGWKERRQNLKLVVVVLFVEVSLKCSFEGMGGLNVMDVRRERIPLLWSTVRERTLAKGFSFNMGGWEVSLCLQKNEVVWIVCT